MSRNKMSGFTLIELMVVIVIIGVLASLAIPRFTEASVKAKVAEAPRVIASYESAYLAAIAEGVTPTAETDLVFTSPTSKWFVYSGGGTATYTATSDAGLGTAAGSKTLITTYANDDFTKSGTMPKKFAPNFIP